VAEAVRRMLQLATLLKELKIRERRRTEAQAALATLDRATAEPLPDPAQLIQRIAEVLKDWRGLDAKHVQATRQLLRKLLQTRITFAPDLTAGPGIIRFTGEGTLAPLAGMLPIPRVQGLVAPTGFEPVFTVRHALS